MRIPLCDPPGFIAPPQNQAWTFFSRYVLRPGFSVITGGVAAFGMPTIAYRACPRKLQGSLGLPGGRVHLVRGRDHSAGGGVHLAGGRG